MNTTSLAVGGMFGAMAGRFNAKMYAGSRDRNPTSGELTFGTIFGGFLGSFGAGVGYANIELPVNDTFRPLIEMPTPDDKIPKKEPTIYFNRQLK